MDLDKIKKMIEDGFAYKKVQQILNISQQELKEIKTYGFQIKQENFSEERICLLYNDGVSIKNLEIKFKITHRVIKKIFIKNNIKKRNNNDTHRFFITNDNIFDNIDSPEKAYWLGFLYADGNVTKKGISLCLKLDDLEHVKKFCTFFNISHDRIKISSIKNGKKIYYNAAAYVFSKYLAKQMVELGCPPRKSFILKYPEWLDEKLISHFVRGYFEGDGCITRTARTSEIIKSWDFNIIGTKEMCEGIGEKLLKILSIKTAISYKSKTQNNTYNLKKGGNESILNILHWLYKDTTENIVLNRKYELYQELKQQQEKRIFIQEGKRTEYRISNSDKEHIINDIKSNIDLKNIAEKYGRDIRSIQRIFKQLNQRT